MYDRAAQRAKLEEEERQKRILELENDRQVLWEDHLALNRVLQLIGGRPGYHTITVKRLYQTISGEV